MPEQKKRKKQKKHIKNSHEHDESCMMEEGAPVHDYDTEERVSKVKKNK